MEKEETSIGKRDIIIFVSAVVFAGVASIPAIARVLDTILLAASAVFAAAMIFSLIAIFVTRDSNMDKWQNRAFYSLLCLKATLMTFCILRMAYRIGSTGSVFAGLWQK